MLIIEIPYWVVMTAVIMSACFGVCSMIAMVFDIHNGNWRRKLKNCKSWVLKKYSDYRYKHAANVTIIAGTHVSTIKELYEELCVWVRENIENPEKTVWTEGSDIIANNITMISVEPTLFVFKFKRAEDLTHFVMRWS